MSMHMHSLTILTNGYICKIVHPYEQKCRIVHPYEQTFYTNIK